MNNTPIASELSYLVLQKRLAQQGKPEVSRANRDRFPVETVTQPKPAFWQGFTTSHAGHK